jgi:protoheme IX farnesyltransferase
VPPPPPGGAPSPFRARLGAYSELCKARLSSLVVVTSGAGFLLAGHPVDWPTFFAATGGTALAAAAANTFNQVYEARTDALMHRTMGRPLPTGRISRRAALAFGGAAAAASAGVLLAFTNPLTAALGAGNIALYALVYTPLKQVTQLNTAVGAVVGAVPPLMGWAAAAGSLAAVDPFLLAGVLFSWQFPHFYALAWPLRRDYARGGYAMVPAMDPMGARTGALITRHASALAAWPVAAAALGVTSPMFAVEGALINAYLLRLAVAFQRDPTDAKARAIFRASLWYLPLLAALMVFHAAHWRDLEAGAAAPGALPRGTSMGEAAEHALGLARAAGRAVCAHELLWGPAGGAAAGAAGDREGGTPAGAGAGGAAAPAGPAALACPVVAAGAAERAVGQGAATVAASAAAAVSPRATAAPV